MILQELRIQNFRSFGNNINTLKFNTQSGELILIAAPNGYGKSSLIGSIDFALFGKMKGQKKMLKNESLPNRLNGNLLVELDFISKNNITIKRGLDPSIFKLYIDNIEEERSGKSNIQNKLDKFIDFDIDTWKSFISMSINDFKNFTTLTPDEKRVLLDRLFNLEMINDVTRILKEKKKNTKHQEDIFKTEINSYQTSLDQFNESIERIKSAGKKNIENEITELKNTMLSKKEEYKTISDKIQICINKENILKEKINENIRSTSENNYKVVDLKEKIELYNSGKCPTCGSDLSSETYDSYKNEMNSTYKKVKELHIELKKEKEDLDSKYEKMSKITSEFNDKFSELKIYLRGLKERLDILNVENIEDNNISELKSSINTIEEKISESLKSKQSITSQVVVLDEMIKLFSDSGIKKSIINKIVVPINHYISENIKDLELNFTIQLDDEFNAIAYQFGQEIDIDTLSTGETKKVNIAIMIAYLKLIRMKRHINILFLDEVFSSIDIEGVYSILKMLKRFAEDFKINIFLIHHAMLDKSYFDRVLKIEKDMTSNIVEL